MANMSDDFGFFTIDRPKNSAISVKEFVESTLKAAEERVGSVNIIILPEAAISDEEFSELREIAGDRVLVSGVAKPAISRKRGKKGVEGENKVCFHFGSAIKPKEQFKHHRWKLNKSQLVQYGLGSILHPDIEWWEYIRLGNRDLIFISLFPSFVFAVLICEDLARPDPVADLVRSVGPDLLIALLMDAPQLPHRWPARHATVYADDPGSSVLTLTCLGMAQLSRPYAGETPSKAVALWKEHSGTAQPIELPEKGALLLSLAVAEKREWSADGRDDLVGFPTLAGVHVIPFTPVLSHEKASEQKDERKSVAITNE
jgi:hypothetical protein